MLLALHFNIAQNCAYKIRPKFNASTSKFATSLKLNIALSLCLLANIVTNTADGLCKTKETDRSQWHKNTKNWSSCYKTIFMLNKTEHEISAAHKI